MPDFVQYRISTNSCSHFNEVLKKLFAAGFVFTVRRIRTIEAMNGYYGKDQWWRYIVIGTDHECSRVLRGVSFCDRTMKLITIDNFLKLNY
jgi:hypothetical protein